ncbi:PIN domain-containing protein [Streptomyces sp. NBC_00117]|uniref:PIN domain-containing protein n=1 Tax=unclassified Streptomyces TaxID=2593676 RepID=UPI003244A17C
MSTFLNSFDGRWRRPTSDYKDAVKNYRIAVDTNVLLELYRFTPKAREELLQVLRHVRGRLWLPNQVAAEYYDRRVSAVKEHLDLYETVPESLSEQERKIIQELSNFAKRCSIGQPAKQRLIEPIEQAFKRVIAEISEHRSSFDLTLETVIDSDPVLKELADIFDGRTGLPFTAEEAQAHLKEAQRRADEKIPPGYKDSGKANNAHGDFFIWEQLISASAAEGHPLLFVTNDAKEDWVRKEAGFTVGARPELVQEFTERCNADFLLIQLGRFLQIAKEELGLSVSESTVAEAENARPASSNSKEKFTIPKRHFIEITDALHAESRTKFDEMAPNLTPEDRRRMRYQARRAGTILDNMKDTAVTNGSDISFRLSREDWLVAFSAWRGRSVPQPSEEHNVTEGNRQSLNRDIEDELTDLNSRLKRLLSNMDSEQRNDVREFLLLQRRINALREVEDSEGWSPDGK